MKKKLWITSLLAALSITVAAGGVALANQNAITAGASENWTIADLDNNYALGTSFDAPEATVTINGNEIPATASVTYPSGLTVSGSNVMLSEAGVYTVTYRAKYDGIESIKKEQFTVENAAYIMQNEISSAEYGKYTNYGANSEGLLVRLAPNDTITFSELLDMDAVTSQDRLFDLFITPNTQRVYDFSKLVITLTDAIDPSYYVRFQLKRYNAEDRGFNSAYIDVSFNGQPCVGWEDGRGDSNRNDSYRVNGAYGSPLAFSFSAAEHKDHAWSGELVDLAPDSNTCYVIYNPDTAEMRVQNTHIANMDNRTLFEQVWEGWPSGKARISMKAEEVKSATANFCVKSIFGVNLKATSLEETDPPEITVSMAQDEMPKGEVNYAYPIPSATAHDFYSGKCSVTTSVYRDYATSSPISVSVANGKFMPTTFGWHTIVYTARDAMGNVGTETRNVYVEEDLGDITVTLPDGLPSEASLGSWIDVKKAEVTYAGDCGLATLTTKVTFDNNTPDDTTDDVVKDITDKFLPERTGKYTVTYTVTDYIGRTGTASFTVDATPGDTYVLLDELILPKIFLSDTQYVLPAIEVIDYSSGMPVRNSCDVEVTDKNGPTTYEAGAAFRPSVENNGDIVTVRYQCNGVEVAVKEIPAVLVRDDANKKIIASNYIYGDGSIETSYKDENDKWLSGVAIIAKEDKELSGWTFATPQLMNSFSIALEGRGDLTKFDGLKITFTDSQNDNEQVSVRLMKKGSAGTTIIVGENSVDTLSVALSDTKQYALSYTNGKFTFGGVTVAVSETDNGEIFSGFSSNLAYIHVDMINANAGASYTLRSVNKANLSRLNVDTFKPNFQILGNFGGNQSLNTVYEIYPAIANDVFAPSTSLSMTVKAPDGSIVVDNNGVKLEDVPTTQSYFITMDQYGKYEATYKAVEEDWVRENAINLSYYVSVIDEQKPKVSFVNATQTTAKVGDVITLPKIVCQDNVTATEDLRIVSGVFNPYGRFYLFEGNQNAIRCSYEGEYKFIVMVFDEQGNMRSVTHTIAVTAE